MLEFKPSLISGAALLSAAHELFPEHFPDFESAISACKYVNEVKTIMQFFYTVKKKSHVSICLLSNLHLWSELRYYVKRIE